MVHPPSETPTTLSSGTKKKRGRPCKDATGATVAVYSQPSSKGEVTAEGMGEQPSSKRLKVKSKKVIDNEVLLEKKALTAAKKADHAKVKSAMKASAKRASQLMMSKDT
jgi:hypothetical protein